MLRARLFHTFWLQASPVRHTISATVLLFLMPRMTLTEFTYLRTPGFSLSNVLVVWRSKFTFLFLAVRSPILPVPKCSESLLVGSVDSSFTGNGHENTSFTTELRTATCVAMIFRGCLLIDLISSWLVLCLLSNKVERKWPCVLSWKHHHKSREAGDSCAY